MPEAATPTDKPAAQQRGPRTAAKGRTAADAPGRARGQEPIRHGRVPDSHQGPPGKPETGGDTKARQTAAREGGRQPGHHSPGALKGEHPEYTFADLVDVVNPLQHIPVVSSVYTDMTGDTMKAATEVAGGTLFGGVAGFLGSVASVTVEAATGDDLGGHMMAAVTGGDSGSAAQSGSTSVAGAGGAAQSGSAGTPGADTSTTSGQAAGSTASGGTSAGSDGATIARTGSSTRAAGGAEAAASGQAGGGAAATGDAALAKLARDLGGSQGTAGSASGAGETRTQAGGGQRKPATGQNALAQLARDLNSGGKVAEGKSGSRANEAGGATGSPGNERPGSTQTANATSSRTSRGGDTSALDDGDFYAINAGRQGTTGTTPEDAAQRIRAEAANDRTSGERFDAATAYASVGAGSGGSGAARGNGAVDTKPDPSRTKAGGADGGDNALPTRTNGGVPENFAERMKNALDKYRAMQNAQ